jgi:hypothetical protein
VLLTVLRNFGALQEVQVVAKMNKKPNEKNKNAAKLIFYQFLSR